MKNAIKKVTAAVMAFTLLGVGSTFTKTVAPESDNTLVASAYQSNPNCQYHAMDTYRVYYRDRKGKIVGHYLYCSCCRGFLESVYYLR